MILETTKLSFSGYVRENGSVGIRNHVVVLPTVPCVNFIAKSITDHVKYTVPILHKASGFTKIDPKQTRTKIGLGKNPNVAAVLVVGMGCEEGGCASEAEKLAEKIVETKKQAEVITVEEEGGTYEAIGKGVKVARELVQYTSEIKRESVQLSSLILGIKCGASDATSGIASNLAVGAAADKVVDSGGTVIFSETSELIGAENVLARRAVNESVRKEIYRIVNRARNRIEQMGIDIRGTQPNRANIRGGISTLEEKSLGAIVKGGTRSIQGVLEYGENPKESGLFIMDGPGKTGQLLTGLTAAGAQLIIFSWGGGGLPFESPTIPGSIGPPIAPVIKVTGNPIAYKKAQLIDVYVGEIIERKETIDKAGKRILREIMKIASGKLSKVETINYVEPIDIYITGSGV